MSDSGTFYSESYFEKHFGFAESVAAVNEHITVAQFPDHVEIVSDANNRRINAGLFTLRSPADYAGRLGEPRGNGKFFLIHGQGRLGINEVMVNMNDPAFNGATFQVASNFNCLELGSHMSSAANGIHRYASDGTQGPPCACAAAGALLYRNYFVPHDGIIGQVDGDLNILSRTPIRVYHGKAFICEAEDFEKIRGFDFSNEDVYQVGVHENVEVTMARVGELRSNMYKPSEPNTYVHQVFCSSLNLGGSAKRNEITLGIVKHILTSEYKTTIMAAWDHSLRYPDRPGSKKLVLTLVGGECFSNPLELICGAIIANKNLIIDSGLEVYLCCYNDRIFQRVSPLMIKLCQETDGGVVEVE